MGTVRWSRVPGASTNLATSWQVRGLSGSSACARSHAWFAYNSTNALCIGGGIGPRRPHSIMPAVLAERQQQACSSWRAVSGCPCCSVCAAASFDSILSSTCSCASISLAAAASICSDQNLTVVSLRIWSTAEARLAAAYSSSTLSRGSALSPLLTQCDPALLLPLLPPLARALRCSMLPVSRSKSAMNSSTRPAGM